MQQIKPLNRQHFFTLILFFSLYFMFMGCKKEQIQIVEQYTQNEAFFSRTGEVKSIGAIQSNSTLSIRSNDIIDTILTMLKEADLKEKFANEIIKKYGYAKWDKSIIVNNINKLKTVIVPVADSNNNVQLLIFAYQIDKNNAAFKIIDKNTKQNKLPLHGDKNGITFTQQTLKGLFQVLENNLKSAPSNSKNLNNTIISNGIYIQYYCWYNSYMDQAGNFTISNTQCSYHIIITPGVIQAFQPADAYFPESGGGGSSSPNVDPFDLIYNCNCYCLEEDLLNHFSESFEPKWGQLGTLENIILEVNKQISNLTNFQNNSFENQLNDIKNHFEANRLFTRDNNNNFIDAIGSKKVDRYLYTFDLGWIDIHHFFYAAYLAEKYNVVTSQSMTGYGELFQYFKSNESAFSYEDLPSNAAGIEFYKKFAGALRNKTISLTAALNDFFSTHKATDPSNAPNYSYIPHIIDGYYAKNIGIKGLTGTQLFDAAYEAFCKKTSSRKQSIREAHTKIPHSSN